MKYLRVRNFEKFQHYKDRRPPWIKLYRDLWSDPRFFNLSETERYFLISFFVIGSQNDNKIPLNASWLRREMATSKTVPVERLIETGWLELLDLSIVDASKPLAPDASTLLVLARSRETETETETEVQRQKKRERENAASAATKIPEPQLTFGDSGKVRMTAREYAVVKTKLNGLTDDYIARLDRYSGVNPKRFKQYSDHHKVLLSWFDNDVKKAKPQMVTDKVIPPLQRPIEGFEKTPEFQAELEDARRWQKEHQK